jgi:septum formation protein
MSSLRVPFRTVASTFHERGHDPALEPAETLAINARGKAREVAERSGVPDDGAVLGADTGVVVDGQVLGKPSGPDHAREMIRALAAREHEVLTAVCLITARVELAECDAARVRMRRMPREMIDWYVGLGEWQERAGGYAIQGSGAALVERVEGDYTTVVGLPVARVVGLLAVTGLAPWMRPAAPRRG